MSNFRSHSIAYRECDLHDIEQARVKHLKKLTEIASFPSNRIDNISPVNYSYCRRPGKKFHTNRNNREIQDNNLKLFMKLYHITKKTPKLKLSNSSIRKEHKRKIGKIDNSLILKRLISVKSSLKLYDLERDFQNHLEYVNLGQRLRLPKLKVN